MPINLLDFYSKLRQYCHTYMKVQDCISIIIINKNY